LKSIPGLRLSEMARHHNKSFCCGAGGGRMWMEETLGNQLINEARTDQALTLDPELIAVSCPFCNLMFEDGLKAKDKDQTVKVLDLAELLVQSLEPSEPG
jgi:Fe-S oxidoreductase